jgi:hypothetical protein
MYNTNKTAMITATLLITGLIVIFVSTTLHSINAGASSDENCDSSYPDVCIASPPPDLDCGDVPYDNIRVVGNDPHAFDREGDGIGCES